MECNYKFQFFNLPFERGEIFSQRVLILRIVAKLQDIDFIKGARYNKNSFIACFKKVTLHMTLTTNDKIL